MDPPLFQGTTNEALFEAKSPHVFRLFTKDDMFSFKASISGRFPEKEFCLREIGQTHMFRLFVGHDSLLMDFWPVYGNYGQD
jgi:hypothetical protein